jgi:hypothetical protein
MLLNKALAESGAGDDAQRAKVLQLAYATLACAGPTATGATLILPRFASVFQPSHIGASR